MNFIKKYWTHFISIIYLIINITILTFGGYARSDVIDYFIIFILALIILVLLSIGIWVEIVGFIIHAATSKDNKHKVVDAILIYFLNIYYIPCYYLKQIAKDTKLAIHNTVYIIISIFLSFVMVFSFFFMAYHVELYEEKYQYQTVVSKDKFVKFSLPSDYKTESVGDYDLYFSDEYSIVGVYLYDDDSYTKEEIIKYHDNFFIDTREEVKITDTKKYKKDGKEIITHTLRGKNDGSINIYTTNVITFNDYPEYVIYVIETCLEEDYNDYKLKFKKIIDDISLNNELDLI